MQTETMKRDGLLFLHVLWGRDTVVVALSLSLYLTICCISPTVCSHCLVCS